MLSNNNGFYIGIGVFLIVLFMGFFNVIPESLSSLDGKSFNIKEKVFYVNSQSAWFVLAILLLMAIWWATEAIPVAVTALIPLALFPILDITSFQESAAPFADKKVLVIGGGNSACDVAVETARISKTTALSLSLIHI